MRRHEVEILPYHFAMIDDKEGHRAISLAAVQFWCAAATITGRTHGAAQTPTAAAAAAAAAAGAGQTGAIGVLIVGISRRQLTLDRSVALR